MIDMIQLSKAEAARLAELLRDDVPFELSALAARLPKPTPSVRDRLFPAPFEVNSRRIQTKDGWGAEEVAIRRNGSTVLLYERNYHGGGTGTFAPFRVGDRWLALVSRDYTCTELMDVETGERIGGEEPDTFGFCPVELFIPRWRSYRDNGREQFVTECDIRLAYLDKMAARGQIEWTGEGYARFGFVAGCIWGDDSSWKVEAFDLRRAGEGDITRTAPWGYAELPDWAATIREAIRFDRNWTPDDMRCGIGTFSFADVRGTAPET